MLAVKSKQKNESSRFNSKLTAFVGVAVGSFVDMAGLVVGPTVGGAVCRSEGHRTTRFYLVSSKNKTKHNLNKIQT